MQQTLARVKTLEKFVQKYGEDAVISQTISKMLAYKIQKCDEEIKKISKDLKKFERTYKKESADFIREFEDGKLGDNMDFIEWSSHYQMFNRLIDRRKTQKGLIDANK